MILSAENFDMLCTSHFQLDLEPRLVLFLKITEESVCNKQIIELLDLTNMACHFRPGGPEFRGEVESSQPDAILLFRLCAVRTHLHSGSGIGTILWLYLWIRTWSEISAGEPKVEIPRSSFYFEQLEFLLHLVCRPEKCSSQSNVVLVNSLWLTFFVNSVITEIQVNLYFQECHFVSSQR